MKDNALYLEADEDITSAIDKLSKIDGNSVQIVVPKRSTMLQSIINLKLLKKAAESEGKELVLVTNDKIAGDLASRVGLAVAPSLGAKPVLTEAEMPADLQSNEEVIEADEPEPPRQVPMTAIQSAPKPAAPKRPMLLRRRNLDDSAAPAAAGAAAAAMAGPVPEATADSSAVSSTAGAAATAPKVPNFAKLQRRVMWVGLAVVLVAGYFLGMYIFSSATVTLYANGTKIDIDTSFAVDPNLHATDKDKAVLAGQTVTVTKDLSGSFTPTGKKDAGTKASGQMTVYNEYDTNPHTLVAGTRFSAPDGKVFRTKSDVTVPGATVGLVGGKITMNPGKSDPVTVEADQAGDTYNEAAARYNVTAYSGDMQTKIYGQGEQMSGGTTKTVTVVTAQDVDTAKASVLDKDKDNATRDLQAKVPSGYMVLAPTQSSSTDNVTPSPAVDAEGTAGTLSVKVTYTVLAVKQSEYQDLVRAQEIKQIGNQNQIYDDGIANAQLTLGNKDDAGRQNFHFTTEAYGGAKIDTAAVTKQLQGKRYGDAADLAARVPGVSHAEIALKPSWATNLPSRTSKIKVTIQVTGRQ